jgi:shikimate kinase
MDAGKGAAGRPLVIELVGPAGAGKSTLLQTLGRHGGGIRAGVRIPLLGYAWVAFPLLPTFLRIHRPYRGLLWKEMKRIVYLQALERLLRREAVRSHSAIVLDEGPVYMLSRLRVFGGEAIESPSFERWWRGAVGRWAEALDAVVWLDAPDAVLARRVRARGRPYPLNDTSETALCKLFSSYRAAFERVISELTDGGGPRVFKFATDRQSAERVADSILCL